MTFHKHECFFSEDLNLGNPTKFSSIFCIFLHFFTIFQSFQLFKQIKTLNRADSWAPARAVPKREGKRVGELEGSAGKLTAQSIWMEEGRERELDGGAELRRDRQWWPRHHRPIQPAQGDAK